MTETDKVCRLDRIANKDGWAPTVSKEKFHTIKFVFYDFDIDSEKIWLKKLAHFSRIKMEFEKQSGKKNKQAIKEMI